MIIKLLKILPIVLLTSILLGCLLLFAVYTLPTEPMRENIIRSGELFLEEGDYPATVKNYTSSRLDNYTDALMCGIAVCPSPGKNVIINAMNADRIWMQNTATHTLVMFCEYGFHEGNTFSYMPYERYWHGYLVVLKPLLLFFDYGDIRIFSLILQIMEIIYVVYLLTERGMKKIIPAFAMMVIAINPVSTALSIQFASVFNLIMIAMIWMLNPPKKVENWKQKDITFYYAVFFCIIGIITAYIDLFTWPIAALGIPLTLFTVLYSENKNWKEQIKTILLLIVCWGVGYVGMWCGKFVAGSLLTGNNVIKDAWESVKYRTSSGGGSYIIELGMAIWKNIRVLIKWPYLFAFLGTAAGLTISSRKSYGKIAWNGEKMLPYLLIILLPLLHMLAVNHVGKHDWFTFREFSVSVFAAFCLLADCIQNGQKRSD